MSQASVLRASSVFGVGWLVAVVFLAVGVTGKIPDGYILDIRPSCGTDHVADAIVTVVTDLPDAVMTAYCSNDQTYFTTSDHVNFVLPVSYPGEGDSPCVFKERHKSETYSLTISVSYGESFGRMQQSEEYFTISCTFDPIGFDDTPHQTIGEALNAPGELQINNGVDISSSVTLTLADILGNDLDTNIAVAEGRKLLLKLTSDGSSGEMGITPTSCAAIGINGSRYSVLRAGCGVGFVFPRHSGFTVANLTATSPYFSSFGVNGEPALAFECHVNLCMSNCDGISCVAGRRKRAIRRKCSDIKNRWTV